MATACADLLMGQGRERLALVSLATAFHSANIVAMGWHLQGDDHNALALLRSTHENEQRYLKMARRSSQDDTAQLLARTMAETESLQSRF